MKNKITLQSLINDLEIAKAKALDNGQINSVIQSVALQAKLLGLDSGKPLDDEPKPTQIIVNVKRRAQIWLGVVKKFGALDERTATPDEFL